MTTAMKTATERAPARFAQLIIRLWGAATGRQWWATAALTVALIAGGATVVWGTGGTQFAYLHLLYVPVVVAGLAFGLPAGAAAGLAAGLAIGPLMPLNVAAGIPQPTVGWVLRTIAFATVGALVGAGRELLHARLRDAERLLNLERRLRSAEQHHHDLAQQVLEDGARERSRLALHVHNEVVAHLVAARYCQESASAFLAQGDTGRAQTLFEQAVRTLDSGISECRHLLDSLRRSVLEPGTLAEVLGAELDQTAHDHGLSAHLDLPDAGLTDLSLPVEILLYETARNTLSNVVRHACATTVTIRLRIHEGHVAYAITDDGQGFDPAQAPGGHGLDLLVQRWRLAGGHVVIDSAPGQGASVHARLPLGATPPA